MADITKIGLLVLNDDNTKFLVCEKDPKNVTADYIMPGGQLEEKTELLCIEREIKEELDCEVDVSSLKYIYEYIDEAAGLPGKYVSIKLYEGKLIGEPKPSTEIKYLHWIGKEDKDNLRVSKIIRDKIIPDLVEKGIIK